MKTKKTKKSIGLRGTNSHAHGARKKWRKSGHTGGCGMAGIGRQGITSRGTERKKNIRINLRDIEKNYDSLMKNFGKGDVLVMEEYKLLGEGNLTKKIKLKVKEASSGALEKVKKAGGSVEVLNEKDTSKNTEEIKESDKAEEA